MTRTLTFLILAIFVVGGAVYTIRTIARIFGDTGDEPSKDITKLFK